VTGSGDLRARRESIVRAHMESENAHDFDTTIGTFGHPRYELVATGDVYDGEEAVRPTSPRAGERSPTSATSSSRCTTPTTPSSSSSICSGRTWGYFDQLSIMRQLGLAHPSTSLAGRLTTLVSHPLTIGRALARRASRRRT
jgi:BRCT domain type II-containing protein